MTIMKADKRLKKVHTFGSIDIYEFSPTLICHYWEGYSKENRPDYWNGIVHKCRMLITRLLYDYTVYYAVEDESVRGHVVVTHSGKRIIESGDKNDIIIGPIWTAPDSRGKHCATNLLKFVLEKCDFKSAYSFVLPTNEPSKKSFMNTGFHLIGHANEVGLLKKYKLVSDGVWNTYRYDKNKQ